MINDITMNCVHISTFGHFDKWVNHGRSWLAHNRKKYNTICLDSGGNICDLGEDFMAARDHNLFPVNAYLITKTIHAITELNHQ